MNDEQKEALINDLIFKNNLLEDKITAIESDLYNIQTYISRSTPISMIHTPYSGDLSSEINTLRFEVDALNRKLAMNVIDEMVGI